MAKIALNLHIYAHTHSWLLGKYLEVELLSHRVDVDLTL